MKRSVLVAVVAMSLIASPARPCVCACNGTASLAEQVKAASAVVVAEVVELVPQTRMDVQGRQWLNSCAEEIARLKVQEVLKGEAPVEVFSRHSVIGTPCDLSFPLEPGKTYVLFLEGECFNIKGCSKSAPLSGAAELVEEIKQLVEASNGGAA